MMTAIAGACSLPILWWNWQSSWVSLRHVGGQAGVGADGASSVIHPAGPLVYMAGQFGLLFGFWFIIWAAAMFVHRPWRDSEPTRRYLWFLSVPQFALFALFSLRTNVMLNWPLKWEMPPPLLLVVEFPVTTTFESERSAPLL